MDYLLFGNIQFNDQVKNYLFRKTLTSEVFFKHRIGIENSNSIY